MTISLNSQEEEENPDTVSQRREAMRQQKHQKHIVFSKKKRN
jgi:hypothetical protein